MTYLDAFKSGTLVLPVPRSCILRNSFLPAMIFSFGNFLSTKHHRLRRCFAKPDCWNHWERGFGCQPIYFKFDWEWFATISDHWVKWRNWADFDASLAFERLDDLLAVHPSSRQQLQPAESVEGFGWNFPAGIGTFVDAVRNRRSCLRLSKKTELRRIWSRKLFERPFSMETKLEIYSGNPTKLAPWRHSVCGSGRGQTSRGEANNPKQVQASADFLDAMNLWRISRLKSLEN